MFRVAPEANTVAGQGLEMLEGLEDALAAESIQPPKQHKVELALRGGGEQGFELLSVAALPGRHVHVLVNNRPPLSGCELPKLAELILRFLTVSTDPAVHGDSHTYRIPRRSQKQP